MPSELTKHVFAVVDARDAALFSGLFAPDGCMIFGNDEPKVGPVGAQQAAA